MINDKVWIVVDEAVELLSIVEHKGSAFLKTRQKSRNDENSLHEAGITSNGGVSSGAVRQDKSRKRNEVIIRFERWMNSSRYTIYDNLHIYI